MSVLAELVVADASEADAILASDQPTRDWEGFGFKGLDNVKLVQLWALMESGDPGDRFEERLKALTSRSKGDDGPWVDVLPPPMIEVLAEAASLDDGEVGTLASSWGGIPEFKGWDPGEVSDLLGLVGEMAESARDQEKTLVLWRSL